MAQKCMKRCSASLITREVQIKITMTHHFTYTKLAIIIIKKKSGGEQREQMLVRIRERFSLYIARGNVKLFSDVVWWFPQNLSIELVYDPVTTSRLYFQRLKSEIQTNTYTFMFTATLFLIAKRQHLETTHIDECSTSQTPPINCPPQRVVAIYTASSSM